MSIPSVLLFDIFPREAEDMRVDVHVFIHDQQSSDSIEEKLNLIIHQGEKIMATLDAVLADVTDESTKLDSLSTFIAGLKQQIADALAGTTLPPAVQSKIDAVFAGVEANKAKVQTALDANVPVTPPTP